LAIFKRTLAPPYRVCPQGLKNNGNTLFQVTRQHHGLCWGRVMYTVQAAPK